MVHAVEPPLDAFTVSLVLLVDRDTVGLRHDLSPGIHASVIITVPLCVTAQLCVVFLTSGTQTGNPRHTLTQS